MQLVFFILLPPMVGNLESEKRHSRSFRDSKQVFERTGRHSAGPPGDRAVTTKGRGRALIAS